MPNSVDTMVCSDCPHVRWRHVFHPAIRGCIVKGCPCKANGVFNRAVGPQIEEWNTNGNTRVRVPQPAPPNGAWRYDG